MSLVKSAVASNKQPSSDNLTYQIFCIAWAVATLFHMAQSRVYTKELNYVLLTLAAIALILKPRSTLRIMAVICLQLYEVLHRAPYISNHWIIATFINLTLLSVFIYLIVKNRSLQINKGEFYRAFAPIVRIEILILYFFVVLHKLNFSFLSVDASCAAVLYKAQHLDFIFPASSDTLLINIYLTLFIETLIPILFVFRSTRNTGLLLGLVFHCIIAFNSFNGFYDFSAMIFASYIIFAGPDFSKTICSFYHTAAERRDRFRKSLGQFSWQNLAILAGSFLGGLVVLAALAGWSKDYFRLIWAAYSFLFIGLFLASLLNKPWRQPAISFRLPHAAFLLLPLLLFLNGASPYLGLKTESSFAMFSNLRTEGGVTNHLFIPVSTQVFDFQKDMVEVLSSSDQQLQAMADKSQLLPYFQFKNHVASNRPARVDYIRGGARHSFRLATAGPAEALLQKSPFVLRKLLGFRAIAKAEPQPCQH